MIEVAMKIHVAAAIQILDPDALRLGNRAHARAAQALMQERIRIALKQRRRFRPDGLGQPGLPRVRRVGFALGMVHARILHLEKNTPARSALPRPRQGVSFDIGKESRFLADPFFIIKNDTTYIFVENQIEGEGAVIGLFKK